MKVCTLTSFTGSDMEAEDPHVRVGVKENICVLLFVRTEGNYHGGDGSAVV